MLPLHNTRPFVSVLALLLAGVGLASGQESLFFSTAPPPGATEQTLSGSSGTLLATLRREDLAIVSPGAAMPYSAETYLSHQNWNTLAGDRNCDAAVFQPILTGGIDAIAVCQPSGMQADRNHRVFLSSALDIPAAGGMPAIADGDVFSYRANGMIAFMLTEDQIRSVFDIAPGEPVDVDAVTVDDKGTIYLSLEQTVTALGVVVDDGAVLVIPHDKVFWSDCGVADTIPSTGGILYTEADMDFMIANSGVGSPSGAPVTVVLDIDGLDADRHAPTKIYQVYNYGNLEVAELRFTAMAAHGGAVLTTELGGSIAVMNGAALAAAAPSPTNGSGVGLLPGMVRWLNGIASIDKDPPVRVTLDTDDAVIAGSLRLDLGGADPGAPVLIGLSPYAGACAAPPSVPLGNPGHSYFFGLGAFPITLIADGQGFASTGAIPVGPGPGIELVLQAVTPKGPGVATLSGAVTVLW